MKKTVFIAAMIFLFALAIRLAYVLNVSPDYLSPDSYDWTTLASNILNGQSYNSTYRGPLYPLVLAGIYSVFGYGVIAVRIFQSILGAATVILIYFTAKEIFSEKTAVIAAACGSIYPYFIYYCADLLSETLLTFLLSLSMFLVLANLRQKSNILAACYGISAGLTMLCKGLFYPFFLVSLPLLFFLFEASLVKRVKLTILSLLAAVLIISPWAIRNYRVYNKFVLFGLSGQSLWLANNPLSYKLQELPETNKDRLQLDFTWFDAKRYDEVLSMPAVKGDETFKKDAKEFILNNPAKFASLSLKRLFHFWRLYPVVVTKRNKILALASSGVIIPFGFMGIILSLKKYWKKTIFPILLIGSFSFFHMVFTSSIRYRVPLDPLVIVFASFFIVYIFSGRKNETVV
jgi:4-amino-4-deoxy-L-arabinose transferase-like glycosyltransferase